MAIVSKSQKLRMEGAVRQAEGSLVWLGKFSAAGAQFPAEIRAQASACELALEEAVGLLRVLDGSLTSESAVGDVASQTSCDGAWAPVGADSAPGAVAEAKEPLPVAGSELRRPDDGFLAGQVMD